MNYNNEVYDKFCLFNRYLNNNISFFESLDSNESELYSYMSSFIDELCEKYKMFLNENNFQINDIPENIRNYVFKGKQKSIAKK